MARLTIEDCLERVENRYALVHFCARRVRQLSKGSKPTVHCDNGMAVTALREIAHGSVSFTMRGHMEDEKDSSPKQ